MSKLIFFLSRPAPLHKWQIFEIILPVPAQCLQVVWVVKNATFCSILPVPLQCSHVLKSEGFSALLPLQFEPITDC